MMQNSPIDRKICSETSTGICVDGKMFDRLSWLVIIVFLTIIGLGVLVPIYADEVATKMTQATVFAEGGRILTLIPQCVPELTLELPFSWYPAAAVYQLLYYGKDPLVIRLTAIATTALWLAVLSLGVIWAIPLRQHRIRMLAVMAAISGLGVLPFTLVLARSEQWFLLLVTVFCVFPMIAERVFWPKSRLGLLVCLLVFCLAISLLFYTHPKSVFFLPVILVSAIFCFQLRSRICLALALIFAIICAIQAVSFSKELFKCENAPILSAYFASQTTNLSAVVNSPGAVFAELIGNLTSAPGKITQHLVFRSKYQSFWLPSLAGSEIVNPLIFVVNTGIRVLLYSIYYVSLAIPPAAFFVAFAQRRLGYRHYVLAALWVAVVGHLAIYKFWNFYGGGLVVGQMVLLIALSVIELSWQRWRLNWVFAALFSIFLLSAAILFITVVPRLIGATHSDGDGLSGQPLSVPVFNFQVHRDRIRSLAATCNLQGDGASRLVVDDLTYFAFNDLRQPLHLVYLFEGGFGSDIKGNALRGFLSELNSEGLITQCTFLPPSLRNESKNDGNLCCINFKEAAGDGFM